MKTDFAKPETLTKNNLEHGDVFAPKFNVDGLITVVTTETGSNELLMVAHMNAEALSLTLSSDDVHYFSRSRQNIWKKGETSGEMQRLVSLRTDCDQDVLLLEVEQVGRGAACHTGHKSCFYRKLVTTDEGGVKLTKTGDVPLFDPGEVYARS